MKTTIKNFMELTRMWSVQLSIAPFVVALLWALGYGVSKFNVILAFVAVICLHLGGNLLDDIIDVCQKLKQGIKLNEICFCDDKNKARLLIDGTVSIKKAIVVNSILFLIPILCGIYFYLIFGAPILFYALIGAILILLYPISSKFYMAEIFIGILFSIILPKAVYFVLTGNQSLNLSHFSVSMFLLMVAVLHTHSITDWEHDEKCGKNTLARLFKTKRNAIRALGWMIFGAYLNLAILISIYFLPGSMIMAFITTPIAVELVQSIKKYIALDNSDLTPRWWMGVMENWEEIKKQNAQYFMYRFYLARNLCVYFFIISALAYAISNYYTLGQ